MMMHQHTKFCYRQLSSLEDTVQAKPGHKDKRFKYNYSPFNFIMGVYNTEYFKPNPIPVCPQH